MSEKLPDEILAARVEIEQMDQQIIELIAKRILLARLIIHQKVELALPVQNLRREWRMLNRYMKYGKALGLSPVLVMKVINLLIEEGKRTSRET